MLVLLRGVIYEVHRWEGLKWHDTRTKFNEDWFGRSGNINVITLIIWVAAVLALLMERDSDGLRWHDIYKPSFINIGSGVQVILMLLPW
jgi:hypothetical protein